VSSLPRITATLVAVTNVLGSVLRNRPASACGDRSAAARITAGPAPRA
jgi:hypothetical protein